MAKFVGYVNVVHHLPTNSVYLQPTKGTKDDKPGTVKSKWSQANVPALVAYMEVKAKELGAEIGKPAASGEGPRYSGIFEPEGRKGQTPFLCWGKFGSVFIRFGDPDWKPTKVAGKVRPKANITL